MCGCWCPDEVEEKELDDAIREVEDEADKAPLEVPDEEALIDVTKEFAIPVRIEKEAVVER